MNKKLITLTLILTGSVLLVGCSNNTQTTESSSSSSSTIKTSSTSSSSSTADSTSSSSTTSKISEGTLTYTDGSKIYVSDEGEFTVTLRIIPKSAVVLMVPMLLIKLTGQLSLKKPMEPTL